MLRICFQGFTSLGVGLTWGSVVAGGSKQLSKSQLLNLFFFSHSLGANFEGVWVTSKQIRITVLDATGAGPPPILVFTIQVIFESHIQIIIVISIRSSSMTGIACITCLALSSFC